MSLNTQHSTLNIICLLLLLMGVAFYLICASNPLRWDDLMYQYVWLDHKVPELLHPIDLSNRVDNFQEALSSQFNHYIVMNGRFIVHLITQCFCGFIGKGAFNVINAIVYVLFLWLGIHICLPQKQTKANSSFFILHSSFFILAGLWFLPPVQWILSFDVVFPINYLWSATMCMAFLILFYQVSNKKGRPIWNNILLFLFGVFCGNFHEGYTLLVSGALFIYALFHFKKLNSTQWCLVLGMWCGTLTVIGSPGIWGRAAGASAESMQEMLVRKLDILRYSKRLYLLLTVMVVSYCWIGRNKWIQFVKDNQVELLIVLFGFMFLIMLPYYSQRMGFPMELFAVLLTLKLLIYAFSTSKAPHPVRRLMAIGCWLIITVLCIHVIMTVGYAQKVGKEYQAMIEEYIQSPEGIAHFQSFEVPKMFKSYVLRLETPFEQGLISFTMQKEMVITATQE